MRWYDNRHQTCPEYDIEDSDDEQGNEAEARSMSPGLRSLLCPFVFLHVGTRYQSHPKFPAAAW